MKQPFDLSEPPPQIDLAKHIGVISTAHEAIARYDEAQKRPLSENVINDLNRILLNSVRGANRTPGEFRDCQVHIGRPGATLDEASYVPPLQLEIPRLF